MLTTVRNAVSGFAGPFLIVLVILAFAFVGVPELRNFTQRAALTVGDDKFEATDVREEFTRQVDYYRRQTGESLTNDEAVSAGLLDATIQTLTARSVIQQEAQRLNLTATNEMVGDYLRAEPAFENPNSGEFDQEVLIAILQNNRMTLDQFREEIAFEILRDHLLGSIGVTTPAPTPWLDLQLKRQGETRQVSFVSLTTPVDAITAPTEEELRGYYDANSDDYMAPEYRTFSAVILRNSDFSQGLDRSEEELRQLFDSRKALLSTPETRTIRQLTYQTEEEANAAFSRLAGGTPFEQLAEEQGFPLERVTYEGVREDDLSDPTLARAIFSQSELGEPIGPIDGLLGYTVAEVMDITPGQEAVFEEERDALEAELTENETSRRLFDAVETIELARDQGATLQEAAADVPNVEVVTYGPVDRNLFTPDNATLEDMPVEILNEAFLLQEGDESQILDLSDDSGYFTVSVDEVRDPQLQPFEEVRAAVRSAYMKERRRIQTEEKLANLRNAVSGGASLTEAAAQVEATVVDTRVSSQINPQNLPRPFVTTLFDADLGNLVSAWADDEVTAYAGIVRDATFPAMPQQEQLIELYKEATGQQIAVELQQAYLAELQNDLTVTQNPAEIDRLFSFGTE